jgi:uncharacterized protein YdhG (YjbR/CyaY superfamily)
MEQNTATAKGLIHRSLKTNGASESLAGAVADAAARAGLSRVNVGYNSLGGSIEVNVDGDVPDALHERLTDMGFERNDDMSTAGIVRYDDN